MESLIGSRRRPGSTGANAGFLLGAIGKMLRWKIRGKTWPHPFFERGKPEPRYAVTVITKEERERVRALSGPRP